jgi:hypothetical protein
MKLLTPHPATVSLSALRWRARAPRTALTATCIVLSVLGLRALLATPTATPVQRLIGAPDTSAVGGFAEGFARAYLSFAPSDPDARERRLQGYGFVDAASSPDDGGRVARRIIWTAALSSQKPSLDRRVVTVLADDGDRQWYLAVTVSRDRGGRLYVAGPPAVVGPPMVASTATSTPELEVEDATLRQAAERIVRHYLVAQRTDLVADLAPRAVVTTPRVPLRVADVVATTWVERPSRVAVSLVAAGPRGLRLTLRYELIVVRVAGRWLVRSIQVNPLDREE